MILMRTSLARHRTMLLVIFTAINAGYMALVVVDSQAAITAGIGYIVLVITAWWLLRLASRTERRRR